MSLFTLPFDHRSAFAKGLLGYPYPRLTPAQRQEISAMKQIVFDGFLKAQKKIRNPQELAILVDEEFGAEILKQAKKQGITRALAVEKSGQEIFDFEYGAAFGAHLLRWQPTYAKALVRYDVAQSQENILQRKRLKILSDFCKENKIGFLLEVLLTKNGPRLPQAKQMIQEMQHDKIMPTIWKLEGFAKPTDWKSLRPLTTAAFIMLGRGEARTLVEDWVKAAAKSGVVSGLAIGRTIFFKPLMDFRDKKISRETAIKQISQNYLHFIRLWKKHANSYDRRNLRAFSSFTYV